MLNRCTFIGNLGADPEVRYTLSGQAVTELRVACTEKWTDKSGAKQEHTEWVRAVVWGKQAENCGKYLTKGRQVYIEGRMRTRQWEDKDGNKRYTTEIIADRVQFLGSGKENGKPEPDRKAPTTDEYGAVLPSTDSRGDELPPGWD